MARTAFVTGGSGFIGGALIRRLVKEGWTVKALARSERSADTVRERGAEAAPGDLQDVAALETGMGGADVVFHAAAHLGEWGKRADFERDNVQGTRNVLAAARAAGVRRVVHVGTEAALLAGQPLVEVDEHARLRFDSKALYSETKARAEEAVIEANHGGLETVVIRPRLVWGKGDTTILPSLVAAVEAGRFAWIGGGRHKTSTTHVDNVIEGLMLGAEKAAPGSVYFVTDGTPVVFRDFVTQLLGTQGVEVPQRSVPRPLVGAIAAFGETAWKLLPLPGQPPVTRLAYWLAALETTIDITRARTDLGYVPVRTIEDGMQDLKESGP
jgi:nucleoside-diphosphate-sugar epimerase